MVIWTAGNLPMPPYDNVCKKWMEHPISRKDKKLSDKEFALYLLPPIAALIPGALSIVLADTPVIRLIFGGWNLFILIPGAFVLTFLGVEYVLGRSKKD